MIPWFLQVVLASEAFTPENALTERCRTEAAALDREGSHLGKVRVWERCLQEAIDRDLDNVAEMRARLLLARLEAEEFRLKARDPVAYDRKLLALVARTPEADFPIEVVRDAFRRLVQDPAERQRLENVRTVTLRWMNTGRMDPDDRSYLDEQLRRFVADMGFRVAPGDYAASAEASIMVHVEGRLVELPPAGRQGHVVVHVYQASFRTLPVKFRAKGVQGPPIGARGEGMDVRREEARRIAAEEASRRFAASLLRTVVRQAFGSSPPPPG